MRELDRNKQLVINMSASFIAYGVTLLISFFLSSYIVRTIGVEANGFVSLANNFGKECRFAGSNGKVHFIC